MSEIGPIEPRSLFLQDVRAAVAARFPPHLSFRFGSALFPWWKSIQLEIIPWSLRAVPVLVNVSSEEIVLFFGSEEDVALVERHPFDEGALDWTVRLITDAGEAGLDRWVDGARFFPTHEMTIAGQIPAVTPRHLRRLTRLGTSEPWHAQRVDLVGSSHPSPMFLVDRECSPLLSQVAVRARESFGDDVWVISRRASIHGGVDVEFIPTSENAPRVRVLTNRGLRIRTGMLDFANGEDQPIDENDLGDFIEAVGRYGLLESEARANLPATPENQIGALTRGDAEVWGPWVAATT